MFPSRNRLKKVDIYSVENIQSGYIGTKEKPVLIGFVYADIQPQAESRIQKREGAYTGKSARLFLRPDAGVKCGDLAAVYGKTPDSRITEVKRTREYTAALAESLC